MNGTRCGPNPPSGSIAVIFISQRTIGHDEEYAAAAAAMEALVADQPGYLGHVGMRDGQGLGVTISYWDSEDHARAWRTQADHSGIRALGRERWYASYQLVVSQVLRTYAWAP